MKSAFFTLITITLWTVNFGVRANDKSTDLPKHVAELIQDQQAKDREIHYFNLWVQAEQQRNISFSCFLAEEQPYYLFLVGAVDHHCAPDRFIKQYKEVPVDKAHVKAFLLTVSHDTYLDIDLSCEGGAESPLYLLIAKENEMEA